jgi:hypothetical protein
MSVVRLHSLSPSAAEDLLVRLWRVLEEYRIASPRVSVEARGADLLDLCLTFPGADDATMVERVLLTVPMLGDGSAEP